MGHTSTTPARRPDDLRERQNSAEPALDKPPTEFARPADVLVDSRLSQAQKAKILNAMEQDARQLAAASAEGMSGGEDTVLREVLEAKQAVDAPTGPVAFATAIQSLQSVLSTTSDVHATAAINDAIVAVERAQECLATERKLRDEAPAGAAKPGSTAELQEEMRKEQLDP